MAGEEGPFQPRITELMAADESGQKGPFLKRCSSKHLAAEGAVAGEECPLKGFQHGPIEKGSSMAYQLCKLNPCTAKRKNAASAATGCSEGKEAAYAAAAGEEVCPTKRRKAAAAIGCPEEEEAGYAVEVAIPESKETAVAIAESKKVAIPELEKKAAPAAFTDSENREEAGYAVAAAIGFSEGEKSGYAVAAAIAESEKAVEAIPESEKAVAATKGEEAPGKKMMRMPREELDWWLSRVDYGISPLLTWIRSEYHKHGYVEVDDGFYTGIAEAQARSDEVRREVFGEDFLAEFDEEDDEDIAKLKRWFQR